MSGQIHGRNWFFLCVQSWFLLTFDPRYRGNVAGNWETSPLNNVNVRQTQHKRCPSRWRALLLEPCCWPSGWQNGLYAVMSVCLLCGPDLCERSGLRLSPCQRWKGKNSSQKPWTFPLQWEIQGNGDSLNGVGEGAGNRICTSVNSRGSMRAFLSTSQKITAISYNAARISHRILNTEGFMCA